MIVLNCILLVLVSAVLAAFAAFGIAMLGVKWYRISSFEGGSGFFVVYMGLLGGLIGALIGLICGLSFLPDSFARFGVAIGTDVGLIVIIGGVVLAVSRLLADIPPTIAGETLLLRVEIRGTEGVFPFGDANARIALGSLRGRVLRKSEVGPLWADRTVEMDGLQIVPGAVPVFTRRGRRVLQIIPSSGAGVMCMLPLPRRPGIRHLNWSEWRSVDPRKGGESRSNLQYRFKVQRRCEPTHSEQLGNFTIHFFVDRFETMSVKDVQQISTLYRFRIEHLGNPLNGMGLPLGRLPDMNLVVTFPDHPAAMLVNRVDQSGSYAIQLITERDSKPIVEHVAASDIFPSLAPLATDADAEISAGSRGMLRKPGLYRVGIDGVFDTRNLAIHHITRSNASEQSLCKSLGLAPDERSFIRLVFVGPTSQPTLAVTDFIIDKTTLLPIDRARMRYNTNEEIDAGWVDHHFAWERGDDGICYLKERSDFAVLPYRGELELRDYGVWTYSLSRVKPEIAAVIEQILRSQFGAELPTSTTEPTRHKLRLGPVEIDVNASDGYLFIWIPKEIGENQATAIAAAINAELATGRHDSLFDNGDRGDQSTSM